jgi:uncharacterized caspase-like protein
VVGVANYGDKNIKPALFSDNDANAVTSALLAQKGTMYKDVQVTTLVNEKATRANIETELVRLQASSTENDVSILFISGHGLTVQDPTTGKSTGNYYFVPYDADFSHDKLIATGVSSGDIDSFIKGSHGKRLIFLDTCFSAAMSEIDMKGLVNLLGSSENGAIVWSSSNGEQESYPVVNEKHGAFTVALLQALHGSADSSAYSSDTRLTQRGLSSWFDNRVPFLSDHKQTPTAWGSGLFGEVSGILAVVPQ